MQQKPFVTLTKCRPENS